MRANKNTAPLAGLAKLLAVWGATFGGELALHAYLGSFLPGAPWLFGLYNHQFEPSSRTQTPLFDLVLPCAVVFIATGALAYRWHIAAFALTVIAAAGASMAALPAYYALLRRSDLWWLPGAGWGLLDFYLRASAIPAAFCVAVFVMRSALRGRDATLRSVQEARERLSDMLLPSDIRHGWTDAKRELAIKLVDNLHRAVVRDGRLRAEHRRRAEQWLLGAGLTTGLLVASLHRLFSRAVPRQHSWPQAPRDGAIDPAGWDPSALLERLSDPLLPSDAMHGWTDAKRNTVRAHLSRLRGLLVAEGNASEGEQAELRSLLLDIPEAGQLSRDVTSGVEVILSLLSRREGVYSGPRDSNGTELGANGRPADQRADE